MFTPPPSPQPSRTDGFNVTTPPIHKSETETELHTLEKTCDTRNSHDTKRRAGRRILWAVILIPFIVIAYTVYGGFQTSLVQSPAPDFSPPSWYGLNSHRSKWKSSHQSMRKRGSKLQSIVSSSSTSSSSISASSTPSSSTLSVPSLASPTSTTSSSVPVQSQTLPTVPSNPTIPTPFPQAFDGIITQNFTSSSCLNFFNNMTASLDFRACRPFSFLSTTSSTFINVSFASCAISYRLLLKLKSMSGTD